MAEFKVLIPLDGSKLAEHALAYIPVLKAVGELQVELASVVDPHAHPDDAEAVARESNLLHAYLGEVVADIKSHVGLVAQTRLLNGNPAACLLDEAKTFEPDLLVISTHGRSGVSRWRLGSVSDKVIRGSERNTLVIGPRAAGRDEWLLGEIVPAFTSIMVPLDGSRLAETALGVAARFAEAFGSTLHLVSVISLATMGPDEAWAGAYSADLMETMIKGSQEYLDTVAARLPASVKALKNVQIGMPAERLTSYVAERAIDLVIMTSHGRGGLARTALGSVTDRLLGEAAPVLVVRRPA